MKTVEYLLPFNTEDGICKDIDSFKSLLSSNTNFKIRNDEIEYKGSKYKFKCTLNIVQDKNCSVFHVTLGISRLTDKFREMLKSFRKTVGVQLKDNIQIIWDGVSFEWSKELYPRIYQIENSLRKLISKFMLTKLGIGWHYSAVPKDVSESIKKENFKPSHSILYEVDFIQLANFLFKPYTIRDSKKLPGLLSEVVENGMDENKKKEILDYIPKNNWDRYFSNLVSFESDQLRKKWEILYEIRCKVAHNKPMQFEDVEQAQKLCAELEDVIEKALDNIDNIEVPEEDQESVGLRTIGIINDPTRSFVDRYLNLNDDFSTIIKSDPTKYYFLSDQNDPLSNLIDPTNVGYFDISKKYMDDLLSINSYKNDLLSGNTFINPLNKDLDSNVFLSTDINSILNTPDFSVKSPGSEIYFTEDSSDDNSSNDEKRDKEDEEDNNENDEDIDNKDND